MAAKLKRKSGWKKKRRWPIVKLPEQFCINYQSGRYQVWSVFSGQFFIFNMEILSIMTTMTNLVVSPKTFLKPGQVIRLLTAILMVASLVACAVSPTQPSGKSQKKGGMGISSAVDSYNSRDFSTAIQGFDSVIADDASGANSRRLAHLGKAMVYLGTDENWHSIENAKMSMLSAGQVAPKKGEKFAPETDMLMDAVSEVIGTESKYSMVQEKSSGSGYEISQLRRELDSVKAERDALKMERNDLVEEQKMLNAALEKLKKISLGN